MPFAGELTDASLNGERKNTRSLTYWRSFSLRAIPKLLLRCVSVVTALASVVAILLVAVLSIGCYGAAKLLGKIRPFRDAYQFLSRAYDRFTRSARPKSSARPSRHSRVTDHGLPQPHGAANFRDPTRFRETSASARDRFLSFAVRSQVRAVCEDVQRQTSGSAPAAKATSRRNTIGSSAATWNFSSDICMGTFRNWIERFTSVCTIERTADPTIPSASTATIERIGSISFGIFPTTFGRPWGFAPYVYFKERGDEKNRRRMLWGMARYYVFFAAVFIYNWRIGIVYVLGPLLCMNFIMAHHRMGPTRLLRPGTSRGLFCEYRDRSLMS